MNFNVTYTNFLSQPTGLEVGVIKGGVKPGSSIAIIGAGPVGLAALITSQLYSPSHIVVIDKDQGRLDAAKKMGATFTINPDTTKSLKEATKDFHGEIDGFDVVIEAVGIPATFEACQELVGKGGAIANVGVHGAKADLHLEKLWGRGIRKSTKRRRPWCRRRRRRSTKSMKECSVEEMRVITDLRVSRWQRC